MQMCCLQMCILLCCLLSFKATAVCCPVILLQDCNTAASWDTSITGNISPSLPPSPCPPPPPPQSALDQQAVERMAAEDHTRADSEAAAVARRAAAALRASQAQCAQYDVSQPTWTGRSGTAGGPSVEPGRRRFGGGSGGIVSVAGQSSAGGVVRPGLPGLTGPLSSAQVIQRLRQVQNGCVTAEGQIDGYGSVHPAEERGGADGTNGEVLVEVENTTVKRKRDLDGLKGRLREVLSRTNQGFSYGDVIRLLSSRYGATALENMQLLRQALESVATEKKMNGESRWFLCID